jgi:hypothetical protein
MDRWLGHLGFLVKLSLQCRMANGEDLLSLLVSRRSCLLAKDSETKQWKQVDWFACQPVDVVLLVEECVSEWLACVLPAKGETPQQSVSLVSFPYFPKGN